MKHALLSLSLILSCLSFSQINEAIRFTITDPNGNTDQTIIRLKNEASTSFDPAWDAWKLFSPNDLNPSIYSKTDDSLDLAINSIPQMQSDSIVHLFIRAKVTSGSYTIVSEQLGTAPQKIKIAIRDLETGDIYPLNTNISHAFEVIADPLQDQMRFEIFYSPEIELNVNMDEITVSNQGNWNWEYWLEDDLGNTICSGLSTTVSQIHENLANGTYSYFGADEYGLIDTVEFEIDVEDPIEEPGVSVIENSQTNWQVFFSNGLLHIQTSDEIQEFTFKVYSVNGALLYQQFVSSQGGNFIIPQLDRHSMVIVQINEGKQLIPFKIFI